MSLLKNKIILQIFLCVGLTSCWLAPGSYPYAELYVLDFPEEDVSKAIMRFKDEHKEYTVPKVTINGQGAWQLPDERTKDPSFWFKFYFYYEKEDQILYTWIRPVNNHKTTFAFVSINQGLNIGNWKDINHDYSNSVNKEHKERFEARILTEVKKILNESN